MASVYLVSALVMGALALAVGVWSARGRQRESYTPKDAENRRGRLSRLGSDSRTWIVGFVLLVLGITGIVLAVLGGGSSTMLWAVAGLMVVGFLIIGTYAAGRSRGHPHAYAIGEAVAALGTVFLVALVGWLVTTFPAS